MKILKTLTIAALVLIAAAAGLAFSGVYNIGADVPHSAVVVRLIETVRDRSIAAHDGDIVAPDLKDPKLIAEGAEHYAQMCTGCHLAPGMEDTEMRQGLYPQPPNLSRDGIDDPVEAFWIIKHGIKMTAMPAWGVTHDDEKIWGMVAFVATLPKMTPAEYAQVTGRGNEPEHEHEHEHDVK